MEIQSLSHRMNGPEQRGDAIQPTMKDEQGMRSNFPSCVQLLHQTLVQCTVLQDGQCETVQGFEAVIISASGEETEAQDGALRQLPSSSMAVQRKNKKESQQAQRSSMDAFMMAATLKPRRYHAKFQKSMFDGPTARKC